MVINYLCSLVTFPTAPASPRLCLDLPFGAIYGFAGRGDQLPFEDLFWLVQLLFLWGFVTFRFFGMKPPYSWVGRSSVIGST